MAERYENLRIPAGRSGSIRKFSDYRGSRVYRQHNHRELELNLVMGGTLEYIIRGEKVTLEEGSILWLFPGQRHGAARFSENFDMLIALFTPQLVQSACAVPDHRLLAENPESVLIKRLDSEEHRKLIDLFSDIREQADEKELYNTGLEYALLRTWQSYEQAEVNRQNKKLHPSVLKMISLMTASRRPNPELAVESGISYSRLSHLFKEQTGQSMGEFRDRLQVEHCCELLQKAPYRTIWNCADEAGFGSYAQFYRVFRKITGKSPGSYRREEIRKV
ncbi:MAG: helix-turn-helix transcriptional regulator [Spirochaetales bacterium]|nr:helix-turn-helix transcriptional regulator [Spirochaetales bacterium]